MRRATANLGVAHGLARHGLSRHGLSTWKGRPWIGRLASWALPGVWGLAASVALAAPSRPPTEEQRAAQVIEKALKAHAPDVHRCFEQALADRLDVSGTLEVELELGPGGKVEKSKVLSKGQDVPAPLSACVSEAAAKWTVAGLEPGASLVLPFAFEGQANQFVVKAADVPDRGPPAPKARGGMKTLAPFSVKVLADPVNVRAQHASMTLLTVAPASRVATHRHPRSAKVLYLLKGHARILGPQGAAPLKLDEGMAVFLPAGYPHAIENMGRQSPVVFLQVFAPPGPERVYRDPADPQGRADFEVLRDGGKAGAAAGTPVVVTAAKSEALSAAGGKATVRILFDEKGTGSPALALSLVEFAPGAEVARHDHPGSTELLYVVSGPGGKLTVGSESYPFTAESAVHVPPGQPHAATFGAGEPTVALQIYAPAGPEQRFRTGTAPSVPSSKK